MLHDKLWNLVPTFKDINSSKNDSLPNLDIYLDKFCLLQYQCFKTAIAHDFSKKLLEDYLYLSKEISLSSDLRRDIFISVLKETIQPLHQIAFNQGFLEWVYN